MYGRGAGWVRLGPEAGGVAGTFGPMHVFITTLGSRGDVQPYVALGVGLRRAGYRVTLSTAARFRPFVETHGLAFGPTTDGFLDLIDSDLGRGAMESLSSVWTAVRQIPALVRAAGPLQHALIADSWAAAEAAAPDVIVYHPKAYWGPAFADALGAAAVLAPLQPFLVPTGAWPSMGFPNVPSARYNRLTHRTVQALTALGTDRYLAPWRRAHGVPDRPRGASILDTPRGEPIPVVFGYSPLVAPAPSDWPSGVTVSGFWTLDAPSDEPPAPALAAFLAAGPAPVYVGFGSMAGRDPARTARTVVAALGRAGVRGVLASGWGGLDAHGLPDSVHALDQAPHGWLFPRCAAVVHHGGAGTTAAGLRAGRPTVVCPFFADQPFWGRRVEALGVGPAPIPQKRLTPDRLAEAVHTAVTDGVMRGRARRLGEKLRAEDGVEVAVRVIEAAA